MENKKFIDKSNTNNEDYSQTLKKIELAEHCPFCPENFKYHKKPILKRKKGWIITENSWPYKNAAYHYVLIPETHKETFEELTPEDFFAISELVSWIIKEKNIPGGALILRFGETKFTGATVQHLHFQLISPEIKSGEIQQVNFSIG